MKTVDNYLKLMAIAMTITVFASSCSDDSDPVAPPLAFFAYEASADNPLSVSFTNETQHGDSYAWDFGDSTGTSKDMTPTYVYTQAGTYTVTLTATNAGGSHKHSESVIIEAPFAFFTVEVSGENPQSITFTNETLNGDSYSWNFGDETGTSTDENPTYVYAEAGIYTVTLTATIGGGSYTYSEELTVLSLPPVNLVVNGTFDDESAWTIISYNTTEAGTCTIADGVATINDAVETAEWGTEAHMGMYQSITVKAGTYQVDMDVTTNGANEAWFEVWIGTDEPVAGSDYSDPHTKALSLSMWDCYDTNSTYSGPMAAVSCQDTDGSVTLDAGTYFLVIRGGGLTLGEGGIYIR